MSTTGELKGGAADEEEMLECQEDQSETSSGQDLADDEEEEDAEPEEKSENEDDEEDEEQEEDSGTSELDDEELDRRKHYCLGDMQALEKQFCQYKDKLYKERLEQTDDRLEEIKSGKSCEYLSPLARLEDEMHIRSQVAGVLRELRILSINNKCECEEQAAQQNFQSDKQLLVDSLKAEIEGKVRRLEEDRHNIDINSELLAENGEFNQSIHRKSRPKQKQHGGGGSDRRRKPCSVTGPYIVYQLPEAEILDDWTAIKKALKQKSHSGNENGPRPFKATVVDGKLFYRKQQYMKGQEIFLDTREGSSPTRATITGMTNTEVMVRHGDGHKSKLFITQLQKGKYMIEPTGRAPPSNPSAVKRFKPSSRY